MKIFLNHKFQFVFFAFKIHLGDDNSHARPLQGGSREALDNEKNNALI
jgi:hypothetical protein